MPKVSPVTYIRAYIQDCSPSPESIQYKPYNATLVFNGQLAVDVPVPSSEVIVEKGVQVLTLEGWKCFLKEYTKTIEQLHRENLNQYKP